MVEATEEEASQAAGRAADDQPTDRQRGKTVHGEPANAGHRILAPDDANFEETYARRAPALGPDEVGSHPSGASPYGVLDLAGNVVEWTRSPGESRGLVVTRGCGWGMCTSTVLRVMLVLTNDRPPKATTFELGFRCVDDPALPASH